MNRETLSSWLMYLIHGANASWIARIFWLKHDSSNPRVNFLADGLLVSVLVVAVLIHVFRWRLLSQESIALTYASRIDLRLAMRRVAQEMYGRVRYLISPIPNDKVLEEQAERSLRSDGSIEVVNKLALMLLVTDAHNFKIIHVTVILLCPAFLYLGTLPSYASLLNSVWVVVPILMCVAVNLLIYSLSTWLFLVLFGFNRREK